MRKNNFLYEVMVEDNFSAAHQLRDYNGKCEKLHGHNWRILLFIGAHKLDDSGFVIDFTIVKRILNEVLTDLDHSFLNNKLFQHINPTAENIATYIFEKTSNKITDSTRWVSRVTVYESEKSSATVYSLDVG